jgi:glycosyltransferase involved in cell wall biosynthesis
MVVGVDAHRAAGVATGVGRQLEYLLRSWSRQQIPFEEVRLFSHAPLSSAPENGRFTVEVLPSASPSIWWQATRLRPRASNVDVFLSPYTLPPGLRRPSVVSNFGIYEGDLAIPGWRSRARSWHFARSARRADAVIANSASTKADLVRFYGIPAEKITVIWPGSYDPFRPMREGEEALVRTAAERVLGEAAPYYLFVGKLSHRRNVPALLEGFADVAQGHPEMRLLLVGANTAGVPLGEIVDRLGIRAHVRHLEHLEHETLALLYRGARAFVLPTEHEGFSGTIPEAVASGCPVVTLDHAALREAGLRDGVLTIRDAAPGTLADVMKRLAEDDDLRAELADRARRCGKQLPALDDHARAVADVLIRVARAER